jgi:hypothetical protein
MTGIGQSSRGLLLNSAGDNVFMAEFGRKVDMDRVMEGTPWMVGKHAVLLRAFSTDLKPKDMIFNSLKLWVRIINLPFGYMHKRWGTMIASSIGVADIVPVVDYDDTGRCWGSYKCSRVEIDIDKPLKRGVTMFSQHRNATDWFDLQYENLPHYCLLVVSLDTRQLHARTQVKGILKGSYRILPIDYVPQTRGGRRIRGSSLPADQFRLV